VLRASDQGEAILVGARRREQRLAPNAEDFVEASAAESELFVVVGPSPCVLRGWTGAPEGFVWGVRGRHLPRANRVQVRATGGPQSATVSSGLSAAR
jgi:hypothetical protein